MANHTAVRIKHPTLAANLVDTVTLAQWSSVEVVNRGTTELYFTVDGTTPTVAGDEIFLLQAGSSLQVPLPSPGAPGNTTSTVVKLVSVAAVPYSVTGV